MKEILKAFNWYMEKVNVLMIHMVINIWNKIFLNVLHVGDRIQYLEHVGLVVLHVIKDMN